MQIQNEMRTRMVATQLARARELLYWWGGFYSLTMVGMLAGQIWHTRSIDDVVHRHYRLFECRYAKLRNPAILAPFLPLTFVFGYQIDLAYGSKIGRIRGEMETMCYHRVFSFYWFRTCVLCRHGRRHHGERNGVTCIAYWSPNHERRRQSHWRE